ncbi:hypothetical protein BRPE67_ACDS11730 [Caballeronia cordobensis]|nr:hypothetical protein BRPE67_ACDS11730 [Burkholderia sp. RPE67]
MQKAQSNDWAQTADKAQALARVLSLNERHAQELVSKDHLLRKIDAAVDFVATAFDLLCRRLLAVFVNLHGPAERLHHCADVIRDVWFAIAALIVPVAPKSYFYAFAGKQVTKTWP